ncbi:MAG: hypothetical protein EOP47_28870, partial [Sphingobacteriaceae bacterium]
MSWVLKAAIVVLAAWFIHNKFIKKNDDLQNFQNSVANLNRDHVLFTLAAVAGLMLLNWFLEALKWQYVTRKLVDISRWQAIESVFCGLTWAIITPNRVGEYGGRIMFLPNRKRIHGLFAMIVGGLGQIMVTNVLGLTGALWFIYNYVPMPPLYFWGIAIAFGGFLILLTLFYFNISLLVMLLNRVNFIKKYHRFFDIMARYNTVELINIFWLSLARFAAFTVQYYLLIHLLLPEIHLLTIVMMVFTFLVVQSALPSLDIFDIGVRTFTATALFIKVTPHYIAVVACVSL